MYKVQSRSYPLKIIFFQQTLDVVMCVQPMVPTNRCILYLETLFCDLDILKILHVFSVVKNADLIHIGLTQYGYLTMSRK